MRDISFLRIPLYKLYYIDNLDSFAGVTEEEISNLEVEYSKEEIKKITVACKWAIENPEHDFRSLLPNMKYLNSEIYHYLKLVVTQLDNLQQKKS